MEKSIKEFHRKVRALRGENGCPWDKEQTFESLRECILNEAKEVIEAIDKKDYENLKEELGDILINIAIMSSIAEEKGLFDLKDVINQARDKLVRRHPHVFGNKRAKNADEALKFFMEEKRKEKSRK